MKKKIIFALILLLTFCVTLSAVSADENATDADEEVLCEDIGDVVLEDTSKVNSTISAKNTVGYQSFSTDFSVDLKANDTALSERNVSITVNNVTYSKTTNDAGRATVSVKLPTGSYNVRFSYAGDENTTSCEGTAKITVKNPVKTKLKVADKKINYRQGLKNAFILLLVDANGKAIKNQQVTIKVNGKKYTVKTDKKGYAEFYLSLKKGKYKIKYSFSKSAPYLSSSGSYKIKVKAPISKGNGYWVWSSHMNSVNLQKLAKLGTKHIFLHSYSIYAHGKSAVVNWIAKAHKYGIKVHIWMQVCYVNGAWTRPCNPDNTIKYGFLNSKIKEAKSYAKIKGVDGVHFDYVRFGGTAHLYKTSTDAINYFVKKASIGVHKVNSNCIVSAAVMPEPKMMIYWYGQDIPTMGRYLDVIVPMVYKGNFNKDSAWITKIVKLYGKQSKSAIIWAGLQSYHSDNNVKKLTQAELIKDARAAKAGGATGSILFRIGITNYLNFKKV